MQITGLLLPILLLDLHRLRLASRKLRNDCPEDTVGIPNETVSDATEQLIETYDALTALVSMVVGSLMVRTKLPWKRSETHDEGETCSGGFSGV